MTRTFGLVAILAALAASAYLFAAQSRKEGPTANAVTQAGSQAVSAAAGTNFQGAAQVLQAWYATNGTYAGATLPPGSGVVLVHGRLFGPERLDLPEEAVAELVQPPDPRDADAAVVQRVTRLAPNEHEPGADELTLLDLRLVDLRIAAACERVHDRPPPA